jgi:ribonuclease HII
MADEAKTTVGKAAGKAARKMKVEKDPLQARFQDDAVQEIGVDEAGRGSFFGPIMAGAVALPPPSEWTEVQRAVFLELRDSKRIAPKKRERLADELRACLLTCAVGVVSAQEINERGIQWANREAFRRAIAGIPGWEESRLLIDGSLPLDDWKGEQHVMVEGDNRYLAIGGASILAKVAHDRWIQAYAEQHPECQERYDVVGSKGYGTTRHREGITQYGGCDQHRELYIQGWLPGAGSERKKPKSSRKSVETQACLIRF